MRHVVYICICLLFSLRLISQPNVEEAKKIDSLNKFILTNATPLQKAKALVSLAELLYNQNPDTLLPLCQKALNFLDALKEKELSAKQAYEYNQIKALAYNNIGVIYYQNGSYAKTLHYYIQSVKIRESINDEDGMMESYNNIAGVYKNQSDTAQAIDYYKKSLAIAEKKNNIKSISKILNNLAIIYGANKKTKKLSLNYYLKSLAIEEKLNNLTEIGKRQHNIASFYQDEGNYEQANEWYAKSLQTRINAEDDRGLSSTLISLARLKLETNQIDEAASNAMKAYKLSKELDLTNNIILASELLYEINLKQKKYKEALAMFVELTQNKEKQLTEANETETTKLQMQYDFDKKLAADSLKTAHEKQTMAVKLKAEEEKQFVLYLFLFVALVFAVFMFNRFKVTKKQKSVIEEQKVIVEEKNKEITDSITYAKRLQQAILPSLEEVKKHFVNSFIYYQPKDIVAGDFYWMHTTPDYTYIAAADCTGHGVPGAMVSVVCSNTLNRAVKEFGLKNTGEILDKTRDLVIETFEKSNSEVKDGMDISLMRIKNTSQEKKDIQWSGANNSLWYIQNNELTEIKANKQPIGKYSEEVNFTAHDLSFNSPVSFYLFSDGYADQFSPNDKKLMKKRFKDIVLSVQHLSMNNQKEHIEKVHIDWKGNMEQTDDVLVMGINL